MFSSSTSQVSNAATYIEDVFSTYLYAGISSPAQTITNGIDLAGKGGLVWGKNRTAVGSQVGHYLADTARTNGIDETLTTNSTAAQTGTTAYTSFNSNGFSVGATDYMNTNGGSYVTWTFRKQPKFFDVVTYTGTGANRTIAHNLGSTPGCIIVKRTDTTGDWWTYHRSLTSAGYYVRLNTTTAQATSSTLWNSTAPTSTEFSLGTGSSNISGGTYVAYLFAHDAGGFGLTGTDNVISCGSYTCVASPGNVDVTLGYEPQFVMVKNTTRAADWVIYDLMRGMPTSGATNPVTLVPNSSAAENGVTGSAPGISPTATGFVANAGLTAVSGSAGDKVIYIAIRRGPMKVPTDATKVFTPVTYTGTGATKTVTAGFPVDLSINGNRNTATIGQFFFDRLRGATKALNSTDSTAEATDSTSLTSFASNTAVTLGTSASGWVNDSGRTYIDWMFKRAPSFFDEVCYTGTGANTTKSHSLGVAPTLMFVKELTALRDWAVYSADLGNTKYLTLNSSGASNTAATLWNSTSPTSTTFSIGTDPSTNESANTYVAYLFATCAGVSKVGSYTGTGTTKQVDCGFAAGARFVLIKRTDSSGDWYVWDSARGIVAGNDPYLLLNRTNAEVTTTDYIDAYSAGFELSSTAPAAINASGGTFIFLAIA